MIDNLKKNFGKRKIKVKNKTSLVQGVFTGVSNKYDLMNDLMSLGSHRLWKKRLVEMMNIQKNEIIIDAVFGYGLNRETSGDFAKTIDRINNAKAKSIIMITRDT